MSRLSACSGHCDPGVSTMSHPISLVLLAALLLPLPAWAQGLLDQGWNPAATSAQLILPNGAVHELVLSQRPLAPGRVGVVGVSRAGDVRAYLFLINGGLHSGHVYGASGRYSLLKTAQGLHWQRQDEQQFVADLSNDLSTQNLSEAVQNPAPQAAPDAEGLYQIDLLVLYTPLTRSRIAGEVADRALELVFLSNAFLENSGIPVRFRIARVQAYRGTDESADYFENKQALIDDAAVRRARDRAQADLVVLLRTNDEVTGFCGLSSGFNGGVPDGAEVPTDVDPERDAFVVVAIAPAAAGEDCGDIAPLFAHELGHTLGGGHQFLPSGSLSTRPSNLPLLPEVRAGYYWRPYAQPHYCGLGGDALPMETIMTGGVRANVSGQGVAAQGARRGDYFSNPELTVDGVVCGIGGPGYSEVERNHYLAMSEAAPYVAAYRGPASASGEALKEQGQSADAAGSPAAGGALAGIALLLLAVPRRRWRASSFRRS